MSTKKKVSQGPYPFASVLSLVPPGLIQFIWMSVASETITYSERKTDFLSFFPVYFQNHNVINGIAITFSLLTVLLGCIGFNRPNLTGKIICGATVLTGIALALFAVIRIYE